MPPDVMSGAFNSRRRKEMIDPADFDIVADKTTSRVWILHEKAFINQNRVTHAEYDTENHFLRFVSKDGCMQYLGAAVQQLLQPHLARTKDITAILADPEGNIKDLFVVPLKQVRTLQNIHNQGEKR